MVDIIVGTVAPVHSDPNQQEKRRQPQPSKAIRQRDRRQNRTDRRQSVRDGVVVTLSTRNDRRKRPDRRKVDAENS
ncbi:hypothetical protein [Desulfatitalea tepidiphila]|uniref:hypothetical protein n=1 Tax=Desulfatitalea tepidiphila TaxID=1185843 RepID=UPI0006B4BAF2|nr:hypothetical protein [Desulfatitalea tepidiphila]